MQAKLGYADSINSRVLIKVDLDNKGGSVDKDGSSLTWTHQMGAPPTADQKP